MILPGNPGSLTWPGFAPGLFRHKGMGYRMQCFGQPWRRVKASGFTLIELIVVIVVAGVLGAVAASRYAASQTFDVPAHAQTLRGLVRYGQKLAIARNSPVYVVFTPAYLALCLDASCTPSGRLAAAALLNSESTATLAACSGSTSWACAGHPTGMVLSGATTFRYDALGMPFATGDLLTETDSSFSTQSVTIAQSGTTDSIVIEAGTGYVH